MPYEYRSYLISLKKNGLSFKTFFKAEKQGKRLFSVVSFIGLLPLPQAELQFGDSQKDKMHFCVHLSSVNKLVTFSTDLELPFGLFCCAIRLLTECELSFFLLGSHESFSPALNTWPVFKDKVLHQITVAFLFQISFTLFAVKGVPGWRFMIFMCSSN